MNDVKRWLDDSPPDAIQHLLRSARSERAPARVLKRTLVALGATSTATAVAAGSTSLGTAAKVGSSMLGIVVKWGGAGLVGGTVLAGAVAGVSRFNASHHAERAPSVAPPPGEPASNPSPELPRTGSVPPAATQAEVASAAPAVKSSPAPSAPPETPPTAREIALIDHARALLRAGDGDAVQRLLIGYEESFSPAHFEPEVLYLRMQSAALRGDSAEARRAAKLIVTRYPKSPEVGRAEGVLRDQPKSE